MAEQQKAVLDKPDLNTERLKLNLTKRVMIDKIYNMTTKNIKSKMTPILKNQGVVKAAIFGSAIKNKRKKGGDIDILVKFKGEKSLFDLVRLKLELEKKTGEKIDILTYSSIHPLLRNIILKEQEIIYEKRS